MLFGFTNVGLAVVILFKDYNISADARVRTAKDVWVLPNENMLTQAYFVMIKYVLSLCFAS